MSEYAKNNQVSEDLAETFVAWWFVRKSGVIDILSAGFPDSYLDGNSGIDSKRKKIIRALPNRLIFLEKNMRCFVETCGSPDVISRVTSNSVRLKLTSIDLAVCVLIIRMWASNGFE